MVTKKPSVPIQTFQKTLVTRLSSSVEYKNNGWRCKLWMRWDWVIKFTIIRHNDFSSKVRWSEDAVIKIVGKLGEIWSCYEVFRLKFSNLCSWSSFLTSVHCCHHFNVLETKRNLELLLYEQTWFTESHLFSDVRNPNIHCCWSIRV